MRVNTVLAAAVVVGALWLELPVGEAAVLVLAIAAVVAAELMNTAVEVLADLTVGDQHHPLAGHAKDLCAASVLVAAAGAAVVGLVVLGRPVAAMVGIGRFDALTAGRGGALLLVLALAVVVVRGAGMRTHRGEDRRVG